MKGLHKAAVVSLTLRRLFSVFGSPGTKMALCRRGHGCTLSAACSVSQKRSFMRRFLSPPRNTSVPHRSLSQNPSQNLCLTTWQAE